MGAYIDKVVEILLSGGIVAIPTETVYGLISYYRIENSWKKIFYLKKRIISKPLALFIKLPQEMEEFSVVPDLARKLASSFWPGPLTIVLKKRKEIKFPWETVGFRIPDHPFVQGLLSHLSPLWSTSANLSGTKNSFTSDDVRKYFNGKIDIIVEEGKSLVKKVPSTVVRIFENSMEILREGQITKEEMKNKLKMVKYRLL